tara:strand:- start:301 stop:786 length:486 start_codon:yes stop_codon:yes gene_type:complete
MASPASIEYNQVLLDLANKLISGQGDGRISIKDIDELFNFIINKSEITSNEKVTLKYIANNYNLSPPAKKYFTEKYKSISSNYYRIIDKVKYDNSLLQLSDKLVINKGDGRISEDDIKQLHTEALDGIGITNIELNTLVYIKNNYNFTEKAEKYFHTHILD